MGGGGGGGLSLLKDRLVSSVNFTSSIFIVTVVELRSVSYNSQFCPLTYPASTASSYLLLSVLSTVAMFKRSHKHSMKVMENLERKNNYGKLEAVLYILNVTSRIKD